MGHRQVRVLPGVSPPSSVKQRHNFPYHGHIPFSEAQLQYVTSGGTMAVYTEYRSLADTAVVFHFMEPYCLRPYSLVKPYHKWS